MEVRGSQPLSFCRYDSEKVTHYWSPDRAAANLSWGEQNAFGRRLADELAAKCQPEDLSLILPLIFADMIEVEGVEIGFIARIGDFAALGLQNDQTVRLAA